MTESELIVCTLMMLALVIDQPSIRRATKSDKCSSLALLLYRPNALAVFPIARAVCLLSTRLFSRSAAATSLVLVPDSKASKLRS